MPKATSFCLCMYVDTHIRSSDLFDLLKSMIVQYGRPKAIRSDNGRELIADALQDYMNIQGFKPGPIDQANPGSNESFNGTVRYECLNAEIFGSLMEAQVVIEQWKKRYNHERPHSPQDYITPEMAFFGLRSQ